MITKVILQKLFDEHRELTIQYYTKHLGANKAHAEAEFDDSAIAKLVNNCLIGVPNYHPIRQEVAFLKNYMLNYLCKTEDSKNFINLIFHDLEKLAEDINDYK